MDTQQNRKFKQQRQPFASNNAAFNVHHKQNGGGGDRHGGPPVQNVAQSNTNGEHPGNANALSGNQVLSPTGAGGQPNHPAYFASSKAAPSPYGAQIKNANNLKQAAQKRPNKFNANNNKQVTSPRKKPGNQMGQDDKVRMTSSDQVAIDGGSNAVAQGPLAVAKAPPIISALDFHPSQSEDFVPNFMQNDMVANFLLDEDDDIAAMKRNRRKDRLQRRQQFLQQREQQEQMQQKQAAQAQATGLLNLSGIKNSQERESPQQSTHKAPILKQKNVINHKSPDVPHRADVKQIKPVDAINQLKKQNTAKYKKQVSISEKPEYEDKKKNLSPTVGSKGDRNMKTFLKRQVSIDSVGKQGGMYKNSDFTLSSNGNFGNQMEDNDDVNSIISEEDSAFEEHTPYPTQPSRVNQDSFKSGYKAYTSTKNVVQRDMAGAKDANQLESKPQNMKQFKRQKTVGWKIQPSPSKQPCRRSPTNKSGASRVVRVDSQGSGYQSTRFKMKIYDARDSDYLKSAAKKMEFQRQRSGSKYRHPHGAGGASRNSSLNYISDAMVDQLSMNFGKKQGNNNRQKNMEDKLQDTNSVVSILTKGGTVINPFGNQQSKNLSIYRTNVSQGRNKQSNSQLRNNQKQPLVDTVSEKQSVSKQQRGVNQQRQQQQQRNNNSNVQFDMNLDQSYTFNDLRNTLQHSNKNLIKVYLQTPYKVLSIDDVNKKMKNKNNRDQLFRAENILQLHTEYRNQEKQKIYGQVSAGFNVHQKQRHLQSQTGQDGVQTEEFQHTRSSLIQQAGSESHLSETKVSAFFDEGQGQNLKASRLQEGRPAAAGLELSDSQLWMNNSAYVGESQKFLASGSYANHSKHQHLLTHQKQNLSNLESEHKTQFYESLREQILRRISQITFQTNIYKKQKKLFSIYGGQNGNISRDLSRDMMLFEQQQQHSMQQKHQKGFDQLDKQSIQEFNDSQLHQNDQNFRISPELRSQQDINNLRKQQLNDDSRDSLHQQSEAHLVVPKSLDMNAVSPNNSSMQIAETDNSIIQDANLHNNSLQSNDMLKDTSIDDMAANSQGQHLRQLIEISNSMNYPANIKKELKQLQRSLFLAEKELDQLLREKDNQTIRQLKNAAGSLSPGKLNQNRHEFSKHSLNKQFMKDGSSLGMQRKSPPIRMDSYQNKFKKKPLYLRKKEFIDEQRTFEGEGSIEKIGSSIPNIKLNYSTIKNEPGTNVATTVNTSKDNLNWRSIENSQVDVKDYFEKKIAIRRSIDKKLHYDHLQNKAAIYNNVNLNTNSLKKNQKQLENKILYQSTRLRQTINNAEEKQSNLDANNPNMNIQLGTGQAINPISPKMRSNNSNKWKKTINGDRINKDISGFNNIVPIKQQQKGKPVTTKAAHAKPIVLPVMPLSPEMRNLTIQSQKSGPEKASQDAGQQYTHLPQIKCSSSQVSQNNADQVINTKSVNSRTSKNGRQNILRQDQNTINSQRSSYGGGIADVLSPLNLVNPNSIEEEDISGSIDQGGYHLKKNSFKFDATENRKKSQLLSESSQTNQQYRKSGTQKEVREREQNKYISMPHLKDKKFNNLQNEQTRMKNSKYQGGMHAYGNILSDLQTGFPYSSDQRRLGFQFKNISPRIIPPGALKDIAYSNNDIDPISPLKQFSMDKYMDHDKDSFSKSATNRITGKLQSVDYQKQGGQIFATSGPAIISPTATGQQSQSLFRVKQFNKQAHLSKGVLSQQRRFSRIVNNKIKQQNMKLNLSNSDLNELYYSQNRGRNSMANSIPTSKMLTNV